MRDDKKLKLTIAEEEATIRSYQEKVAAYSITESNHIIKQWYNFNN